MTAGPDTDQAGPVRPGEALDWVALEAYLRPLLGVDAPLGVRQFPNGSANLTYLLEFGPRRFVLRRPPFGEVAPGAHDMRREYRVLSQLWQAFDRAPRAFCFCDDRDVIGADFVVSDYRSGVVIWSELPPSMAGLPDAGHRVGLAVVDALAELHLVDPAGCGLSELGRPVGFVARQVSGWTDRWRRVATEDADAVMTAVAAELAARLPAEGRAAIVHNDFKPDNCQFQPGQPDRVTSVFDWDMATLGDPLIDLGTLLNYWPDPGDTDDDRALSVAGLDRMGLPSRAEVVARYVAVTGVDPATIAWYEAFASWKTAAVREQLHHRFVRGETSDPRMGLMHENVVMLAQRARRLLADLS